MPKKKKEQPDIIPRETPLTPVTLKPLLNKRAIVILAIKHNIYARFAHNLALSIRQPESGLYAAGVDICLIADSDRVQELDIHGRKLFDRIITIDNDLTVNPFYAKLQVYDIISNQTPYEEVLYLDADMVVTPGCKAVHIFEELKDTAFTISNRGHLTPQSEGYDWAEPPALLAAAETTLFPNVASEFIYWKNTATIKKLFDEAKVFYLTNNVINKSIADCQPDEPAIAYGMLKAGVTPHQTPYYPTFWEGYYKNIPYKRETIYTKRLLSMGGSQVSDKLAKFYDSVVLSYATRLNTTYYKYDTVCKRKTLGKERLLL